MAKDMSFGSSLFVLFLWSVRAITTSQEGKKKNGKASDFNWTDDEIQLLPEVCFDFKQKVIMKEWTGNQNAQSMNR